MDLRAGEAVARRLDVSRVMDLSATPFFLRGSGYAEGTLFPWTMSDFSLMDAIECGIVKLPRVPVADNIPGQDMPMFRKLWEHIRDHMPKKGRGKAGELDPWMLPVPLQTALEALYGHYEETFRLWEEAEIPVPPCFIIVCNNTSSSKLVYEYVSGFERPSENGNQAVHKWTVGPVSQFRRPRQPPRPSPHPADRQPPARVRRRAGQELPQDRRRRDRALSAGAGRAHRKPQRRR